MIEKMKKEEQKNSISAYLPENEECSRVSLRPGSIITDYDEVNEKLN